VAGGLDVGVAEDVCEPFQLWAREESRLIWTPVSRGRPAFVEFAVVARFVGVVGMVQVTWWTVLGQAVALPGRARCGVLVARAGRPVRCVDRRLVTLICAGRDRMAVSGVVSCLPLSARVRVVA
jgi:hypothetical protein